MMCEKEFGTRSRVRVKTLINGVPADRALMPTKSGFHMIVLGGEIRRAAKLRSIGDKVNVELWLDPEPDRIDIPEELAETLDSHAGVPGEMEGAQAWYATQHVLLDPFGQDRYRHGPNAWPSSLRRFDSGDFHFGGKKQDP